MLDKLLKVQIMRELIKPMLNDIGSGFSSRRPKGLDNITEPEDTIKFKKDYIKQSPKHLENMANAEKTVLKNKSNDKISDKQLDNMALSNIERLLKDIKENTKPKTYKEKIAERKETKADNQATQELIKVLKDQAEDKKEDEPDVKVINNNSSSGSVLDDFSTNKDKNKKNKNKKGLVNKAKNFLGKNAGKIATGVGTMATMGTEAMAGVSALAMANPITATILGVGAVGYGGYKIWDSMRGSDDNKAVFDYLDEIGVIDHDIIGNSEVLNWGAIRKLNTETLEKLIGYDDFSDEDTDKLMKILQEAKQDKKIENVKNQKIKKATEKKKSMRALAENIYGSGEANVKLKKIIQELKNDPNLDYANLSPEEQQSILYRQMKASTNQPMDMSKMINSAHKDNTITPSNFKARQTKTPIQNQETKEVSLKDVRKRIEVPQLLDEVSIKDIKPTTRPINPQSKARQTKTPIQNPETKEIPRAKPVIKNVIQPKKERATIIHNHYNTSNTVVSSEGTNEFSKIDDTSLLIISNGE